MNKKRGLPIEYANDTYKVFYRKIALKTIVGESERIKELEKENEKLRECVNMALERNLIQECAGCLKYSPNWDKLYTCFECNINVGCETCDGGHDLLCKKCGCQLCNKCINKKCNIKHKIFGFGDESSSE